MSFQLSTLTDSYTQLIGYKERIDSNAEGWSGEYTGAFKNILTNGLEKYCDDLQKAHNILVEEHNNLNNTLDDLEALASQSVFSTKE